MTFSVIVLDQTTNDLRSSRELDKASPAVEFLAKCIDHYNEKHIPVFIELRIEGLLCMRLTEKYTFE